MMKDVRNSAGDMSSCGSMSCCLTVGTKLTERVHERMLAYSWLTLGVGQFLSCFLFMIGPHFPFLVSQRLVHNLHLLLSLFHSSVTHLSVEEKKEKERESLIHTLFGANIQE